MFRDKFICVNWWGVFFLEYSIYKKKQNKTCVSIYSVFLIFYISAIVHMLTHQRAETLTLQKWNRGIAAHWPMDYGGKSSQGWKASHFSSSPVPVLTVQTVHTLSVTDKSGAGREGGLYHLSADAGHVLRQSHWFYWLIHLWFSHIVACL